MYCKLDGITEHFVWHCTDEATFFKVKRTFIGVLRVQTST